MRNVQAILFILFLGFAYRSDACSMYKVSVDGTTIIGNNEDAWRTTPHLWVENGQNGSYGCAFTGSREIGQNKFAAQSGMNVHGLTFSRLTSYHPTLDSTGRSSLKSIENPDQFLMDVMHACKNIDEVFAMLDQYDRSCFIEDVFVYVEPSGRYLVVEPYELISGSDPSYVQANFCPSITSENDRRKLERYRKGYDFLDKRIDTSWEFCTNVSKEMHVCRDKIGDGTLLTTIWNTTDLQFKLFFYHDFDTGISFDLMEELAKGDHQIELKSIFPENEEFAHLERYITPFNTTWLRVTLAELGGFFCISSFIFMIGLFTAKSKKRHVSSLALLFILLFISFCYMFVLTTTIGVFYLPAPYVGQTTTITVGGYFPYVILFLILIIGYMFWKKAAFNNWNFLSKGLLFMNAVGLVGVIIGFFYWRLL
ncbi:MAG: hypothetical protein P8P74_17575 [Crocinitomicaceae bacterium]|nr:hypothetical protein [Crocinitomicaceae bacterium]